MAVADSIAFFEDLPSEPLTIIEGGRRWPGLGLRDLWTYRELLYFLAWRDVKVRYKQTVLGAAWAILQPLLTMVVFTVLFGRLARMPTDGEPYPLFCYTALLPWNFFVTAVSNSSSSLVANNNLITKVYFPRLVIPAAAVSAGLVDLAIASAVLMVMMPCYGIGLHPALLMLGPLVAATTLFAAAVGAWSAAMNVKYRDVRYALPFAIQILMFLTPIIYPVSFVPTRWRWALGLNPMSGIVQGFRDAVFGRPFQWTALALSFSMAAGLALLAAFIFRRMEREFADII
ncbi:MAG: ABC transporter permease [Deltaproteobacteria bacterium]|nr:ABC transporter permease [Deltaproteobacteria bacterium]